MVTLVKKSCYGTEFWVVDPQGAVPHTLGGFDDHEPVLERWVKAIGPQDVCLDIGAHFGCYTLPALAKGACVIAYEPTKDGYDYLVQNVAANGWENRCIIRRAALWDETTYDPALYDCLFQHPRRPETTPFAITTLDADLDQLLVGGVTWAKLDPEGAELPILRGGRQMLERDRPRLIIEDHDGVDPSPTCVVSRFAESLQSSERIHAMLSDLGYGINVVPWDVSRKYIVATPHSRIAATA